VSGLPGGGGEYDVQLGFGWTNGVIMEFLNIFGDRLDIKRADLELLRWTPPSNHSIPVIETDNDFWLG